MRSRITGTGSAVPAKVLTNHDLEKMVDTSHEWIVTRTGICERRIAAEGEYTSTLCAAAARQALAMAGRDVDQVDAIITATITPDFPFPATACVVQGELGAKRAFAFDISAACSGFVYGLSLADSMIRSGNARRVLVIGAEVLSRILDWTDRNTCVLFGDGAGAVLLEADDGDRGVLSTHLHSDGSNWNLLYQPGCGSRNPAVQRTIEEGLQYLNMNGNEIFKLAVRAMEDAAQEALFANGMTIDDVSLFIPHQANRRIVDAIGRRLGVSEERVFVNLDRYGNTSAASIPIALDEAVRSGQIRERDIVLFDAFGGGLTWASALLRW